MLVTCLQYAKKKIVGLPQIHIPWFKLTIMISNVITTWWICIVYQERFTRHLIIADTGLNNQTMHLKRRYATISVPFIVSNRVSDKNFTHVRSLILQNCVHWLHDSKFYLRLIFLVVGVFSVASESFHCFLQSCDNNALFSSDVGAPKQTLTISVLLNILG